MKVDPWQWSMPPLWPLHGVFVAHEEAGIKIIEAKIITAETFIPTIHYCYTRWLNAESAILHSSVWTVACNVLKIPD